MDTGDERAEELASIAAIYPELSIDPSNPYCATLEVPVAPEKPLKISFQSATERAATGLLTPPSSTGHSSDTSTRVENAATLMNALKVETHELSYLPSLHLQIDLPEGYPHEKPPTIAIVVEPGWLPQAILHQIKDQCSALWEDYGREQVVFTFVDYVREAADKAFGLADDHHQIFELEDNLKLVLLDYDMKCKKERFDKETFDCGVCLEPKKGKVCHQLLLCGHVFCISCLQDYYNNAITEGDVDNVKCLTFGCAKDVTVEISPGRRRRIDKTLGPNELLQIPIAQQQVQRYVRLKRKKALEADKNTVYCPRQWCQGAARSKEYPKSDDLLSYIVEDRVIEQPTGKTKKKSPDDIPIADRLCICEDCGYAFCSVCKRGWHGETGRCNPRRQAELDEEEKASLEYMQRFSTPCPTCSAPSQKTHGCNHMICFKCKTHFCYLCSAYLVPENPYRHFNDLKSTCYMRLWELEAGDGADAGYGFAGGAGRGAMWEPEPGQFDSDEEDEDDDDHGHENLANDVHGHRLGNWDEPSDDSDDEEPAPDQRRPERPQIELINFAANGAVARIAVPNEPRPVAAPPVVPEPPRRRRRRRPQGNRNPPAAAAAVPAPRVQPVRQVVAQPQGLMELAAPGQGNNVNAGLQRFLRLALEDREDEWDSDEDEPVLAAAARPQRLRRH